MNWDTDAKSSIALLIFDCNGKESLLIIKNFSLIITLEFGASLLFKAKMGVTKISELKNWSQLMQSFILETFFLSRPLKVNCLHLKHIPKTAHLLSIMFIFFLLCPNFI